MRCLRSALALGLLLALPTHAADELHDELERALGVAPLALVELELPALELPLGELGFDLNGTSWLQLEPHSVRADSFELLGQEADGALWPQPIPAPRTLRGASVGELAGQVAGSLHGAGLWASSSEGWALAPASHFAPQASPALHVIYVPAEGERVAAGCGSALLPPVASPQASDAPQSAGGSCLQKALLAVDADFELYLANGSSVAATLQEIESALNIVNLTYESNVLLTHELGTVIVRQSPNDPYTSSDPGTLLNQLASEWKTTQASVERDLVHLASGKNWSGNIIGLAFIGGVCSFDIGYGQTQFTGNTASDASILGHELGHNWNAPHCLDTDGCFLMCGGCQEIGSITAQLIMEYAAGLSCLEPAADPPGGVKPKAIDDSVLAAGPTSIDHLANDVDGDCEPVLHFSNASSSQQGGSVVFDPLGGAAGNGALDYAPASGFLGADQFGYQATSSSGGVDPGKVFVCVREPAWRAMAVLPLDDAPGSSGPDDALECSDGSWTFAPDLGQPGASPLTGTSADFDGASDRGTLPASAAMNQLDGAFSVATFLRPDSLSGVRRVLGNPYAWSVGMTSNALRITLWGKADLDVPAGLQLGQWAHVAWVLQADGQARFYVNGQRIGTLNGPVPDRTPFGEWHLGHAGNFERWNGGLDELQVYDFALSDDEVCTLANHPGQALEVGDPIVCGPSATPYGCDLFPLGTLGLPFGLPSLGSSALFAIDNPLNSQNAGALPFLAFATAPDPNFPCGTLVPGFGAAGGGQPGEALLALGGGNPFQVLSGPAWSGSAVFVPFALPNLPQLAGVKVYTQALLVDALGPNPLVATNGLELLLGF